VDRRGAPRTRRDMTGASLADAYSRTGGAWEQGPGRIYRRLSEVLVACLPGGVAGRDVLDLGAGTGAAGRAAIQSGAARVVEVDFATGLLAVGRERRPPAVASDIRALGLRSASFDSVIAAFSLNHIVDPDRAAAEAARVLRPDGELVVSSYAADDTHPVKQVVERACAARGWSAPDWYRQLQRDAAPLLATPERALDALASVLPGARAEVVRVPFPELDRRALVEWRLGMAQFAPFVAELDARRQRELADDASAGLADDSPLVRSIVVISWQKPG
jgi:SAM-dependent methyltransferase